MKISFGCRICMRRITQVVSEVPKPLMRFPGTCQFLCTNSAFSVTCFCLEAAVNHQNITGYPASPGRRSYGFRFPKAVTDWCKLFSTGTFSFGVIFCLFVCFDMFLKEKVVCFLHTTNCSWKIRNCSSQSFRFIAVVDFLLFLIGYGPSAFKLLSCINESGLHFKLLCP